MTLSAPDPGNPALPSEQDPRIGFTVPTTAVEGQERAGVLVLHGFTGSVYSVRDWALSLTPEYSVSAPALPGHDGSWEDLADTTWHDWYDAVARELDVLRERHERVVVAGLSMGGALALRLAETRPQDVDGVVVVNPALSLHNRAARAAGVVRRFVGSTPGIGNDVAKPGANEHAYERTPVAGVAQLNRLMAVTTRGLGRVEAPVLVLRSRQDHIVSDPSHERIMRGCSGPVETVILPRSYHVATLDHDAPTVNARTRGFVSAVASGICPITGTPLPQKAGGNRD